MLDNIFTGLPDRTETQFSLKEYLTFFEEVVNLLFDKLSDNGICILCMTDSKVEGTIIAKCDLATGFAARRPDLKLIMS